MTVVIVSLVTMTFCTVEEVEVVVEFDEEVPEDEPVEPAPAEPAPFAVELDEVVPLEAEPDAAAAD